MPKLLVERQRTDEWLKARRGKITASLAAACLGQDPNKGPLAAYNQIMGVTQDKGNKHTAWGVEFEPKARSDYEWISGNLVTETGFWVHTGFDWLGASPDGLISDDGVVEIKCPSVIPDTIPVQHRIQVQVQLACTNREWGDYFAWNQNGHLLERVVRDHKTESEILLALLMFFTNHIQKGVPPPRRKRKT